MDLRNEENITVFEHPLIQHKISLLRDKKTGTNEFRKLVEEIAMLEGFEAMGDLELEDIEVETPIETCMTPMIAGRKLAIVPILRAGLGMVSVYLALFQQLRLVILVCTEMRKHTSHTNITASFQIQLRKGLL